MSELTERLARKHFERGRMFELQDKLEDAVAAYRQACALNPELAEPYFCLGRLEATGGRTDEALEALNRALSFGEDPEIVEWRGYVLGRLRRYEEALADYLTALPGGAPGVRVNAGRMLLALGRYDEAEAMLRESGEPSAMPLLDALPRYREYIEPAGSSPRGGRMARDPVEEARAVRYLFGATMVLGTLGDGGIVLAPPRYLLLTFRHCALTIGRLLRLVREQGWRFDGVAGTGPHHGPVALAVSELLEVPIVDTATPGQRVLLAHAVVNGAEDAQQLRRSWNKTGAQLLHFSLGFVPVGDPSRQEPDVVGLPAPCAVEWYRVEPWARLQPDGSVTTGEYPGFRVGPAFFDGNMSRVAQSLVEACRKQRADPVSSAVLDYYRRHPQLRAFGKAGEPPETTAP